MMISKKKEKLSTGYPHFSGFSVDQRARILLPIHRVFFILINYYLNPNEEVI